VVTAGAERTVTVDDAYIKKSLLEPAADVVQGFQPLMPTQQGLVTEGEIRALTSYIKSLQ
jgi:cytochrome c oxidase subunit 2